jgi:carboxyl-terminal processing protease
MEKTNKKSGLKFFYAIMLPIVFIGGIVAGQLADFSFVNIGTGRPVVTSSSDLQYDSVEEAYDTLVASYDGELDKAKLIDGLKKGLAEATGDPYTEYFSAEESKEFNEQISGSFSGIGAELGKQDNAVVIVAPIKGFPAEKAGIKSKDIS